MKLWQFPGVKEIDFPKGYKLSWSVNFPTNCSWELKEDELFFSDFRARDWFLEQIRTVN